MQRDRSLERTARAWPAEEEPSYIERSSGQGAAVPAVGLSKVQSRMAAPGRSSPVV